MKYDQNLNEGHRSRLKHKFLKSESGTLYDYEILELLLCYSIPRKDVKPLAKLLLHQFGNLGNLLSSPTSKLVQTPGIGESTIILLKSIKEVLLLANKEQISKKPIFSSWQKLIAYLRSNIGYDSTESMKALFLNSKNLLLGEQLFSHGTVNKISVYPREILKAALYHEATAVILVHNHPSGFAQPSQPDIDTTIAIKDILKTLEIELIDHVIISPNNEFSFKCNALI